MKKGILDEALTYLAGSIDYAPDDGVGWREKIKAGIKSRNINLSILDPTKKFGNLKSESKEEKELHFSLKEQKKYDELTMYMKKIVRQDLRQIDFCDFLIAKIDVSIHSCGTYHEIILADNQHKPVLLIVEGGKNNCPSWLFGILDHNLMFNSEIELLNFLNEVNNGKMEIGDKWILFRKEIKGILD